MIAAEEALLRSLRLAAVLGDVTHDHPGIYFISTSDGLFTKIGWVKCSQWADLRLEQVQIGNPVKLRLELVLTPGAIAQERKLHRRFEIIRSRGEWFRREGELRMILDAAGPNRDAAISHLRSIVDPD